MLKLKGIIWLPECSTKDGLTSASSFLLRTAQKEYHLSSVAQNPSADLLSWRNTLDFVIEESQQYANDPVMCGWLMKKGEKGHTYQNWKRRWFILLGNCLFYYEDRNEQLEKRKLGVSVEHLKGFIELSQITNIGDLSSDEYGFQFTVTVNNDKSYIFATKSYDDKISWMTTLRERIEKHEHVALNSCSVETLVKSGELKRLISIKQSVTNYFVLTSVNLRVYSSKPDLNTLPENWAKGLTSCIPLLGCSIQSSEDSDEWDLKPNEMAIIELQGHAYVLETASVQERSDWVVALKTTSRALAKAVVQAGETIRLTCSASDKNGLHAGYTIMTINKEQLELRYLMIKKLVTIPFSRLKMVFLQPGFMFCLKYMQDDKAKQLKMKCANAGGIFDAVEAIFDLAGASDRLQRLSSPAVSSRALAHPSVSQKDALDAVASGSNKSKKNTRESILLAHINDDAEATQAALQSGGFSDLHDEAAPPSKKTKKKPLKTSGGKSADSPAKSRGESSPSTLEKSSSPRDSDSGSPSRSKPKSGASKKTTAATTTAPATSSEPVPETKEEAPKRPNPPIVEEKPQEPTPTEPKTPKDEESSVSVLSASTSTDKPQTPVESHPMEPSSPNNTALYSSSSSERDSEEHDDSSSSEDQ